jgi:hypothetical protein
MRIRSSGSPQSHSGSLPLPALSSSVIRLLYLTKHVSVTLEKERLDLKRNDKSTMADFEHAEQGRDKNE